MSKTAEQKVKALILEMKSWYEKDGRCASSVEDRTSEQRAWDHAILTAAEFIRRLDDYDETRATAIHELLSTKLPKDAKPKP